MDISAKGLNVQFPIYNADGTSFEDLVLHKSAFESVVMSLGDKITGDAYYKDNTLAVTMQEYIEYEGVRYVLVTPPTIVREGLVKDNSAAKGLTKYSFTFYHPMYMLGNFEFTDVAVTDSEERYLAQNKTFSWIGYLRDFVAKLNANLAHTEWIVRNNVTLADDKLSEVLSFDNNFISDALKTAYETWEKPFTIQKLADSDADYQDGKRYAITFGMPNEMVSVDGEEYVFKLGQGVGLKNNSRTPKNNKIVTRISGYGSESNIPYGYPQIVWTGDQTWDYTIDNDKDNFLSYPIYDGVVNGQKVRLIMHPFTRNHLMPSIYGETVNKKVNPLNTNYDPETRIIDYYDADNSYPNPINPSSPSYEIHQFEDIKPELGDSTQLPENAKPYNTKEEESDYVTVSGFNTFLGQIMGVSAIAEEKDVLGSLVITQSPPTDKDEESVGGAYTYKYEVKVLNDYFLTEKYESSGVNFEKKVLYANEAPEPDWDDTMDDDGNYLQSYFQMTLPQLSFDLYACASITEEMKIYMRSGACIGCTFPIQVDWEDYKKNFYDSDGKFNPQGEQRDYDKYPDSSQGSITVICQKEYETFGTIMPNVYQQPKENDIIVFLGISLPLTYIQDAEQRLDDASKEYMLENNVPHFEYPLKFDEYFLANNLDILQQIHNNTRIKFQFGGESTMALFVKQISIKWGDNVLPQYDITLTDDIEVVLNQIGQVTEDVSSLRVQMSEMQKYYAQNLINDISSRLSRIQDDIALGKITFQQGLDSIGSLILHSDIRSNNYIQGMTTQGRGWRIDELGNAEVESIRVRSFMEIMELLVNRVQAQEGDTMFTDNDQIDYVEKLSYGGGDAYRLSLKEKWGGYITTQSVGNILRGVVNTLAANLANVSDVTTGQSVETDGSNKYYTSWMQCIATSNSNTTGISLANNQILVSLFADNQTPAGTNFEPCELMTIARMGNVLNPEEDGISSAEKERRRRLQSLFILSNTDGRITRLVGVNSPKLVNGNYGATFGELPAFVKAYANVAERVADGADYLYAQGIVVEDLIKIDKQGNPKVEYIDKGEWQDNTEYLFNQYNEDTGQYETHNVWHNGNYWRCKTPQPYNNVYYEPTDNNSLYWQKLLTSGSSMRTIYSYSGNTPTIPSGYEQDDEYVPANWSVSPLSVSASNKNVYISKRTKTDGTWGAWSSPALFAHYAEDGTSIRISGIAIGHYANFTALEQDLSDIQPTEGDLFILDTSSDYYESEGGEDHDGYSSPTVMCYINAPDFTWEATEADEGDGYMVDGDLFVANESSWENVGQIKGDKGDDGKNTATVFIYKRSASQPTSSDKPTSTTTYSFADGTLSGTLNGWSVVVPNSDGNPCWVRQVFVQSEQSTTTISASAWGSAFKLVEDGNGIVSITNTYAISSQGTTSNDTTAPAIQGSWSSAQPITTNDYPYLWKKEVTVYTDTSKNTTKYCCMGKKGDTGESGVDAPQANLFGYDRQFALGAHITSCAHSDNGFVAYTKSTGDSIIASNVDIIMAENLPANHKYAISGKVTSPVSCYFRIESRQEDTTFAVGSDFIDVVANVAKTFKLYLSPLVDIRNVVCTLLETTGTVSFEGIYKVENLKIEDVTDTTNQVATSYNGLAENTLPIGQNILADTYGFADTRKWGDYNGQVQTNSGYNINNIPCYYGSYTYEASSSSHYKEILAQSLANKLKPNTWYTLSYWLKCNIVNNASVRVFVYPFTMDSAGFYLADGNIVSYMAGGMDFYHGHASSMAWTKCVVKFRTPSTLPSYSWVLWRLQCDNSGDQAEMWLTMPKIEEGDCATEWMDNVEDRQGKIGKNYYYGGDFDASDTTTQFSVTDYETPYFAYNNNKWVWVGANGTYTMAQMGAPSSASANWQIMVTDFKYLISEAIFANFAKLGSFVISGDWMISQNGTVNGVVSTDYNLFDPSHPNDNTGENFIPSYAVDGLTGKAYINDANVAGTVYADKGEFQGLMQNSMYSPWHDLADTQDKSYDNNFASLSDVTYKIYTGVKNAGRILRFAAQDFSTGYTTRATLVLQGNDTDPDTGQPINEEYFYYHGIGIKQLSISYGEVVELLGLGTKTKFLGWLVLNKTAIQGDMGLPLNCFVKAMVNANGTIYSSSQSTTTGLFSVSQTATGTYKIVLPNNILASHPSISGHTNSDEKRRIFFSTCKTEVIDNIQYPYFIAQTTDINGNNVDCAFDFFVYNGGKM